MQLHEIARIVQMNIFTHVSSNMAELNAGSRT